MQCSAVQWGGRAYPGEEVIIVYECAAKCLVQCRDERDVESVQQEEAPYCPELYRFNRAARAQAEHTTITAAAAAASRSAVDAAARIVLSAGQQALPLLYTPNLSPGQRCEEGAPAVAVAVIVVVMLPLLLAVVVGWVPHEEAGDELHGSVDGLRKHATCFGVFPMFVPSLSW